jgi:tRNA U34 5-methylaminomethyl-2-thiouridine-forming methyltransferase MnmC
MTREVSLLLTADGSTTLVDAGLQETYHSVHGALRESRHVYLKAGLEYRAANSGNVPLRLFEVGFGTGLNACLSLRFAMENHRMIEFHSIESHPLPKEIWEKLQFPGLETDEFRVLHKALWDEPVEVNRFFILHKHRASFIDNPMPQGLMDVVFYDAFAPAKQPAMWNAELLQKVAASMAPGGVLVTYCAQGQFKRDLKAAGLKVESLPGPPGKREMVRAFKP